MFTAACPQVIYAMKFDRTVNALKRAGYIPSQNVPICENNQYNNNVIFTFSKPGCATLSFQYRGSLVEYIKVQPCGTVDCPEIDERHAQYAHSVTSALRIAAIFDNIKPAAV